MGKKLAPVLIGPCATRGKAKPLPSLQVLAKRINTEHKILAAGVQQNLKTAMTLGDLLLQARLQLDRGEFTPWIEDNCHFSLRTAQVYMRVADKRKDLEAKIKEDPFLNLGEALHALTPPFELNSRGGPKVNLSKKTLRALPSPLTLVPKAQNSAPTTVPPAPINRADSAWTDQVLEAEGGPLATEKENQRNDFLDLADIAARIENMELQGVTITDEMREAADKVITVWTRCRERLG
jgi:hypothetical protein